MKRRNRNIPVMFWVTPEEHSLIEQKMAQLGTENMSAYLRKIAIDGYVVRLELPELRELIALLRRSSNNLNQISDLSLQIKGSDSQQVHVVLAITYFEVSAS